MEKRILFDTSVYGQLVIDKEFTALLLEKKKNIELVFYGNSVIRNELRATPKNATLLKRKLRTYLLETYDSLVTKEKHNLKVSFFVEQLGGMYYEEYRNNGGIVAANHILNDFFIVACASIYQMDIVVSGDKKTFLNSNAIKAYRLVNQKQGFRNPIYLEYSLFRTQLIKRCDI